MFSHFRSWRIMKKLAALLALSICPLFSHAAEIAHWSFDEQAGTVAHDSVGSTDGTLSGSAAFVPGGISGNAISLANATNDLVNMGNNFSFSSGSFSVVAWIKTTATGASVPVAKHE